jgi:energy-coupling factor transporter transmembrane protein EcfT
MFTKTDIDNYFISYRQEHLFLLLLATVALIVALVLYFGYKKDLYKGFAIGLASFAILFFTTSFTEYKRADRLRVVNAYNYDMHPEYLKTKELDRINSLQKTINIKLYFSLAFVLAAIGLYIYATKKLQAAYLQGIALAVFFMAGIAATTFYLMQKNVVQYKNGIVEFTKEIIV